MLEPNSRTLLLDALCPPEGYDLDFAIGTTFTLDLLALLTAPLGFTLFDLAGAPNDPLQGTDALLVLKTIRRYADRISIFCDSGRIAVPRRQQLLFSHLERSVIEVKAPTPGHLFHPKVWVLRFVGDDGPIRYRLLCLTRNLTFDRSWDTALVVDGELADRTLGFATNRPLSDFVASLPAMAVRPVPDAALGFVATAQSELRRVRFEVPEPFDEIRFWPLGIDGYRNQWPFQEAYEMLVMSPFVAADCLERVANEGAKARLISRVDQLEKLAGKDLSHFDQIFVLDPNAADSASDTEATDSAEPIPLVGGLHAKTYVADVGWDTHVWTGSANATDAAFNGNVEFLVELVGKKSKCGIDVLLKQEKGVTSLADMLREYVPPADAVPCDPDVEAIEASLEAVRSSIAHGRWVATVGEIPNEKRFNLTLEGAGLEPLPASGVLSATCRPAMLGEGSSRTLPAGETVKIDFGPISFEAISSFFAFTVTARSGSRSGECKFALNVELVGAPSDRRERVLQSLLKDKEQVLRFLLLLLTDQRQDLFGESAAPGLDDETKSSAPMTATFTSLLEPLLRALDRDPSKLDHVEGVLRDLGSSDEGRALLPTGLEHVWAPIWAAREKARQ
jgi:hypothetical protein